MRWQIIGRVGTLMVGVAASATDHVLPTHAFASPPLSRPGGPAGTSATLRIADSGGIDIIRMLPPPPRSEQPIIAVPASPQPPLPTPPQPTVPDAPQPPLPVSPEPAAPPPKPPPQPAPPQQAQPLGRTIKLPVSVGSSSTDPRKGWLGVRMENLELPLALSLGRVNAKGALIVDTTAGGPAVQADLRFGDIVVAYNGKSVEGINDLRLNVEATTPGNQAMLDVWRVGTNDGDFLRTLRRLGDAGNAYIMYRLGKMYGSGIGVASDEREAARWYQRGADAGNVQAMTAFAAALFNGRGTDKNQQEAVRLLKIAAGKEYPEAMHYLGLLLAQGNIVEKDPTEAVRLFSKAAEAGNVPAMVDLGLMHNNGNGTPVDFSKAAMWYKRAADLGNSSGMVNLGFLHQQGKGVAQDDTAAANLYRLAANDGHPAGFHNLASMYDSGRGVAKDPAQAAVLVLRALELRNQFSYLQMTQHSNSWSLEFRRALQQRLKDAGFYTGRIDGIVSDGTIAAINAYINRSR